MTASTYRWCSFNIQMVFSRNGFMLAGVACPPNEEPEGQRFAKGKVLCIAKIYRRRLEKVTDEE